MFPIHKGSFQIRCATLALVFMIALFAAMGCSRDSKPTQDTPRKSSGVPIELIGTWTFQSATVENMPIDLATVFSWGSNIKKAQLKVAEDSSAVYQEMDAQGSVVLVKNARFVVSGNEFSVTVGTLPSDKGSWSITDNKLRLTGSAYGYNFCIIAVKEI